MIVLQVKEKDWFTYKLYNEANELINEAETELAFVGRNTWKPCPVPGFGIINPIKRTFRELMQEANEYDV